MKRIKFNTTFKEDEDERIRFFASLSYSERLRYFLKARKLINFHEPPLERFDLKIDYSYRMPNSLLTNLL